MSSTTSPVYYELSWSILSTIGLVNVLFGFVVAGITSFSHVALVPIVTSAAGAVANGLCYYAYYASYPIPNQAVAAAVADVAWLVQEAGMSFYSYVILTRVLRRRTRTVFISVFWTILAVIVGVRAIILVQRLRFVLGGSQDDDLQHIINSLHIGYFVSIALLESFSSAFLLRRFAAARTTSVQITSKSTLFSYLMRSTEIRVALLAVVGTTRAITYSFQTTAQSATNTASQVDRFAYTLECLFPMLMMIDILGSKLAFANQMYGDSSQSRRTGHGHGSTPQHGGTGGNSHTLKYGKGSNSARESTMYKGETRTKTIIEASERDSSQERIIEEGHPRSDDIGLQQLDHMRRSGINKTVEIHVSGTAR